MAGQEARKSHQQHPNDFIPEFLFHEKIQLLLHKFTIAGYLFHAGTHSPNWYKWGGMAEKTAFLLSKQKFSTSLPPLEDLYLPPTASLAHTWHMSAYWE